MLGFHSLDRKEGTMKTKTTKQFCKIDGIEHIEESDQFGRVISREPARPYQLSDAVLRMAMTATDTAYFLAKCEAKLARKAGYMSIWGYWMSQCKVLKKRLAILANMLHRRLFYRGVTMVAFPCLSYTIADVYTAVQQSHRL